MSDLQKEIAYEMLLCSEYGCEQIEQYEDDDVCNICMDTMKDGYVLKTPCNHFFHWDCIYFSLKYGHFKCIDCNEPFKKTTDKDNKEKKDNKNDKDDIEDARALSYYS